MSEQSLEQENIEPVLSLEQLEREFPGLLAESSDGELAIAQPVMKELSIVARHNLFLELQTLLNQREIDLANMDSGKLFCWIMESVFMASTLAYETDQLLTGDPETTRAIFLFTLIAMAITFFLMGTLIYVVGRTSLKDTQKKLQITLGVLREQNVDLVDDDQLNSFVKRELAEGEQAKQKIEQRYQEQKSLR